jgi:hypothetical protein
VATELPAGPQPTSDPDLNYDNTLSGDLSIAARALTLGAALYSPDVHSDLSDDLVAIGFSDLPPPVGIELDRSLLLESDEMLGEFGLDRLVATHEQRASFRLRREPSRRSPNRALWGRASSGDPVAAVSWLRAVSATDAGVRQVAAAAALRPGEPGDDTDPNRRGDPSPTAQAADSIVEQASVDSDIRGRIDRRSESSVTAARVTQEIASVSLGGTAPAVETNEFSNDRRAEGASVSTIVHGTASYLGTWWTPYGDFHGFLKDTLSPDLYDAGQYYHWSGKYSAEHRELAARRLLDWAQPYGGHLRQVFAHSYGGIIALRALGLGLRVEELVLLSTPVENVDTNWSNAGRVCSLRIHLDLVLLAARRRQSFDLPVAEFHLPKWFIGHADSHDVSTWMQHDVARILTRE